MRRRVGLVSLVLALLLPVLAASDQKTDDVAAAASSNSQACAAEGNRPLPAVNADYGWRLRAYEELDCALAILDDALKANGSVITLRRQEVEQARARVWAARDAAARIGH